MSRGLPNRTARTQKSESLQCQGTEAFGRRGERNKSSCREASPVFGTLFFYGVGQLRLLAMQEELKRVLLEALVVSTVGFVFAVVANFASPRGLSLTRNYFPGPNSSGVGPGANSNLTMTAQKTDPAGYATSETVSARLGGKGLQPIDGKEAIELFRDPQYELEMTVFVDARNDRHYQEGHVPGASSLIRIIRRSSF